MQIKNITNTYYPKLNFGSNIRTVRNADNNIIHRNTTSFFRNDIIWDDLAQYIGDFYKDSDKVNIYCFGCSDGSEPYSLAASIKSNVSRFNKFFPIYASDYDDVIIESALKGEYRVLDREMCAMDEYTKGKWRSYFERSGYNGLRVKKSFKDFVRFKTEDITESADKIQKGPKIILCRNLWPYLSFDKKEKLMTKIKEKSDDKTLVIIGSFDNQSTKISDAFIQNGFVPVNYTDKKWLHAPSSNVWKKKTP